MESIELTPNEVLAGLRMMKAIAIADASLDAKEVSLIEAAARALGHQAGCSARDLEPITPSEAKIAFGASTPLLRERALQASMIASMIDGKVSDLEVEAIASFARELEVDEPRLHNLEQLSRGHIRRMWLDLARRSFARPIFDEALEKRGIGGVLKIALPMIGLGKDADLARRYNDLGKLDEGTLGRAYWRFIVDNELGFPGEGVVAEEGVWHDITHVLAGYGTDPEGEVQVVSFIAGYRREDPFFWLFTIALQFHLGIKVSPYSPGLTGRFDPHLVIAALRRGMAMTRDLSVDYDHWPDMPLMLDEVRAKYGVPMNPIG
jgi:hypothetical protein